MRGSLSFLSLLALPAALAVPAPDQTILGGVDSAYAELAGSLFGQVSDGLKHAAHDVLGSQGVKDEATKWLDSFGREFVQKNGLTCGYKSILILKFYSNIAVQTSSCRTLPSSIIS